MKHAVEGDLGVAQKQVQLLRLSLPRGTQGYELGQEAGPVLRDPSTG